MCEWDFHQTRTFWSVYGVAFIGLAGVVVGSLVSGGVQWLLAERQARRTRRLDKEKSDADFMIAGRLVMDGLDSVAADLEVILIKERLLEVNYPLDRWQEYSPILARNLSEWDWNKVSTTIYMVSKLVKNELRKPFDDNLRESIEKALEGIHSGNETLYNAVHHKRPQK